MGAGMHRVLFTNDPFTGWAFGQLAEISISADSISVTGVTAGNAFFSWANVPSTPAAGPKLMVQDSGTGTPGSASNPLFVAWGAVPGGYTQIINNTLQANLVPTPTANVTVSGSFAGANNTGAGIYAGGRVAGLDAGVHPQGLPFDGWEVTSGTADIINANSRTAHFTLPAEPSPVTVTAIWGELDTPKTSPILINQVFGRDNENGRAVSRSFIELYNTSPQPYTLNGYSLQLAATVDSGSNSVPGNILDWAVLSLDGITMPGNSFFLVVGNETNINGTRYIIPDGNWDIVWPVPFSNRAFSAALVAGGAKLTPVITPGEMMNVVSFVTGRNSANIRDNVNNEPFGSFRISGSEAARRINFKETGNNAADFENVRYAADGITDLQLFGYHPRWSGWTPPVPCAECGSLICECQEPSDDVVLMSLTRTAATAAEPGNRFSADSGVFASGSYLTAWDNNTQITIGGTGRAPVVINNAALTTSPHGDWKSAGHRGITADTATAFQIQFSTEGYENITFTAKQRSTGSGPNAFALAYSASPTGPYIPIAGSTTTNLQAPSAFRSDSYTDFDWPGAAVFTNFGLPLEVSNMGTVYLRVYFNGLDTIGRNGNTSINDIVIKGTALAQEPNYGDVNGSGAINSGDVTMLKYYIASSDRAAFRRDNPTFNFYNARVAGGTDATAADVSLLQLWIATPVPDRHLIKLGPRPD
jgi:hypothetical protein